jgi:hypothetical protein
LIQRPGAFLLRYRQPLHDHLSLLLLLLLNCCCCCPIAWHVVQLLHVQLQLSLQLL